MSEKGDGSSWVSGRSWLGFGFWLHVELSYDKNKQIVYVYVTIKLYTCIPICVMEDPHFGRSVGLNIFNVIKSSVKYTDFFERRP